MVLVPATPQTLNAVVKQAVELRLTIVAGLLTAVARPSADSVLALRPSNAVPPLLPDSAVILLLRIQL